MRLLAMTAGLNLYVIEGKEPTPVWKFVCRDFNAQ